MRPLYVLPEIHAQRSLRVLDNERAMDTPVETDKKNSPRSTVQTDTMQKPATPPTVPLVNIRQEFDLDDPGTLPQLVEQFEDYYNKTKTVVQNTIDKTNEFEIALRKWIIDYNSLKFRYEQESHEFALRDEENRRLKFEKRQTQDLITKLESELKKSERDKKEMQERIESLEKCKLELTSKLSGHCERMWTMRELVIKDHDRARSEPQKPIRRGRDQAPNVAANSTAAFTRNDARLHNMVAVYTAVKHGTGVSTGAGDL